MNGHDEYPDYDRRTDFVEGTDTAGGNRWEHPGDRNRVEAFWETWKASVLRPAGFFPGVDPKGPLGPAIGFLLVAVVLGAIFGAIWQVVLPGGSPGQETVAAPGAILLTALVLTPIFAIISLFIAAGIFHLILLVLSGTTHGYTATVRALCYASGPAMFSIVPVVGQVIGMLWGIVVAIIALRDLQRTRTWKAALAILLPVILLAILMIIALMIGAAATLLAR